MKRHFSFLVEIDVEDMSIVDPPDEHWYGYNPKRSDAKNYVKVAVSTWGGQYHPTDPFFPTNIKVTVR